jgi:glutamate-5-semialdehyde dehydrogenase
MNPVGESATVSVEALLKAAREASYQMAQLPSEKKDAILERFAQLLEENTDWLLAENKRDLESQEGQIAPAMYQRLKLDAAKIRQLAQGMRDIVRLPDPIGRTLDRTLLDDGLELEKRSVPLGVIGIIFESRPDVIPQILSLILKSGNAVVLKGGREALHSNRAFMELVSKLSQAFPELPPAWAQLLDSREAVHEMLKYPQYVDLVIPRGSNQLVQSIMEATRIPVLGHADGVCHLYVHRSADPETAVPIVIDAKAQYPAACNALETLLVDEAIAANFLTALQVHTRQTGITLKGCERTRQLLGDIPAADEADWRTEYGDLTLAVKLVDSPEEAIAHINHYGSHHTDGILAEDRAVQEQFLNGVDSASVFVNASTRFADGFRYGFGAEIGISTARTHARGPVGLDGLVTYKYRLMGSGQKVADYVGEHARPFKHEKPGF